MNKIKAFFSKVGQWFKGAFTTHNIVQVGKVATDVGAVVADTETGNVAKALEAATNVVADAKGIKVEGDFAWNHPTAPTPYTPSTVSTTSTGDK